MDGIGEHHVKGGMPGSEDEGCMLSLIRGRQINVYTNTNVIIYMYIYIYIIYTYICNGGTVSGYQGEERQEKNGGVSNTEAPCLCVGRWCTNHTESC
jgi:hypothetical protein